MSRGSSASTAARGLRGAAPPHDLLAALSSETARRILATLHEEPAPPGELADRVDTSLQNAQYHLAKLEDAGAIEVVGTAYSEKGREMSIYGPADSPLVIFAGEKERASGLRAAVSRLFAGFLALGVGGAVVQSLFGEGLLTDDAAPEGASTDGAEATPTPESGDVGAFDAPEATPGAEPTPTPIPETEEAATAATEAADGFVSVFEGLFASGMPPGLAFFLGGAIVLTIAVGVTYLRARP
ncbi:MAG: ArsR/SmtB family transcription factor [Halobacteriota archaeon]